MLAIHIRSGSFAAGWVQYCEERAIPYRVVDCYSSDIIQQLDGCRALLWHWEHYDYSAALFARQLIASLEARGVVVFPGTSTCWHYDDKVGQKYLLEAVGAPLIPSHVFYDQRTALDWLERARFPIVWKLRGGAGSQNVRLVRSLSEALRIVKRSFGRGWRASRLHALQERLWHFRREPGLISLIGIGRGMVRALRPHQTLRRRGTEKNYVYFQEFVPGNDHDIRVIVIGDRAFAIKRMVRDDDFRASGSGVIHYDKDEIPESCIRIAFDVTKAMSSQCCAFDFVRGEASWKIVEVSYAFSLPGYRACPGYWNAELEWAEGPFHPEHFIVEDILRQLENGVPQDA